MTYQTKKCLICEEKATSWTGHVLDGKEKIIAGWCSKHQRCSIYPYFLNKIGCYGGYHARYGKEKWGNED